MEIVYTSWMSNKKSNYHRYSQRNPKSCCLVLFFTLDKVFLDCRSTFLVLQYKWNANAQIEKPKWTLILMTNTCLSTQHDSSKGVKIASIWNISYQFIYQLTDLNCAFLTDQAITQNYMCLLLYADNQYAVAKIGDKNRGGGGGGEEVYTIFSQTIEKQKKKNKNFTISTNELQISSNELQISSNRAIYTYKIFNWKSPKKVKIATLWRDHLILRRGGGLQILSGQGGGFAQVGGE